MILTVQVLLSLFRKSKKGLIAGMYTRKTCKGMNILKKFVLAKKNHSLSH